VSSNASVSISTTQIVLSVTAAEQTLSVSVAQPHAVSIAVAQRGPAGSGAGVNYLTDAEPAGAAKELWFNDLTQSLKVHDGSEWKGLIPDGGYF
jgi:hypothetical protein